jgi:hypothetical protein
MSRNDRRQWAWKRGSWRGTHRVMTHRSVTAHPGSKAGYRQRTKRAMPARRARP